LKKWRNGRVIGNQTPWYRIKFLIDLVLDLKADFLAFEYAIAAAASRALEFGVSGGCSIQFVFELIVR